jgi:uncharacterized membrane protein YraQ (UPF0718 family)
LEGGVLVATLRYFEAVWPALAFGIVVGAVVRSTISPAWIGSLLGGRGLPSALAGAACGSPLMLCSCCVTPVFTGVRERGARLGPALALMLASPGLNLAALALTFVLLPPHFGVARVLAVLTLVLSIAPVIGARADAPARPQPRGEEGRAVTLREVARRFARSLVYMVAVTVPFIAVGVVLSSWLLPYTIELSAQGAALAVVLVALAATCIALPTFFEIPIALLLLELGAHPGAAMAVLVAGPIVNLPSLIVLARESGARVAVALAASVWFTASLAGWAVSP